MKKIILICTVFMALSGWLCSCTNLDEQIYSKIPADKFFKSEQDVVMTAGGAYSWLRWQNHLWGAFTVITNSADEACTPYRDGGQWNNNKEWVNLHLHEFKVNDPQIGNTYNFCFQGIAKVNMVLYQMELSTIEFAAKDMIMAEMKVLRAYLYYCASNWFGDVPFTTSFTDLSLPPQKSRKFIMDFVLSEIEDNIEMLDDKPSPTNYGRILKGAAYMLQAKVYINYNKWFGEPKWDEAIKACDDLKELNAYSLESDYFANFSVKNEGSKENIFVIPYDPKDGGRDSFQWSFYCYSLHPNSAKTFGFSAICWNGICGLEAFYNSYDKSDKRINSWLEGPQEDNSGSPIMDMYGNQLNHTPKINGIWTDNPAKDGDGVRINKWAYDSQIGVNYNMDNDYAVFRYSDYYMIKAEAIIRKNGGTATQPAVDLVNEVRRRAFGNNEHDFNTTTLTMDAFLAELGREFAWEMHRRDDLIRFGKWGSAWWEKAASPAYKEVYPIPISVIETNPNIAKTPGYTY